MTIQEALNIFGLSGQLTKEDIKKAYRKASLKHHPDRNKDNPIAAEIMKAINAAFDFLSANFDKINDYQASDEKSHYNYGEELERVLSELTALAGIVFEVIGNSRNINPAVTVKNILSMKLERCTVRTASVNHMAAKR